YTTLFRSDVGDYGQDADPRARRHEGLGVDRGDVVLRTVGVRGTANRHRVRGVRLFDVHRILGPALRVREDRLPDAPGRGPHHRAAREADRGYGGHGRLLHSDVCPAYGP